jgi:protein-disulfide isomerase
LERKQDTQRDSVAQSAIKTYEAELLRDSDSPVVGNLNGDVTIVEFMGGDIAAWCAWHGFTVSSAT